MQLNCIIDGNYILSKLVFTLYKNNLLYGSLYQALENSLISYRKFYPFTKVYLVSDSKEKSWRKNLESSYKSTRKKDIGIDWKFVYDTYDEFKKGVKNAKILESPGIEGDDWISLIVQETNKKGQSNLIITNDYDIKQLLHFNINEKYINLMSNEMYNKEKIFLPTDYQMFFNKISSDNETNDIFNLNNNSEFIIFINKMLGKYHVNEVDNIKSLLIKLISGDISDNIKSAYQTNKSGKIRNIGEKGAESIYDEYIIEFGNPDILDPDIYENIADIICTKKKLSKNNIEPIINRIKLNMALIDLRIMNFPPGISEVMNEVYNKV